MEACRSKQPAFIIQLLCLQINKINVLVWLFIGNIETRGPILSRFPGLMELCRQGTAASCGGEAGREALPGKGTFSYLGAAFRLHQCWKAGQNWAHSFTMACPAYVRYGYPALCL